jgi:hypothetical protein
LIELRQILKRTSFFSPRLGLGIMPVFGEL